MPLDILAVDHVQISVPPEVEAETKRFYRDVLGFTEIPKPNKRGGGWFQHGSLQIHVSLEEGASHNRESRRHICYRVGDLDRATEELRRSGVDILPDDRPVAGWRRVFIFDPGGNRIEIAQQG
jgi:catechol 2,3-dioxygenase-like lactoylglutathione lyase family enzyme